MQILVILFLIMLFVSYRVTGYQRVIDTRFNKGMKILDVILGSKMLLVEN